MPVGKTKKRRKTSLFTWFVVVVIAYFIFSSNSRRELSSTSTISASQNSPSQIDSASTERKARGVSSKTARDETIQTVQANEMVSKAVFGHYEVGGDPSYTTLWVWMSGSTGKDYDVVARHFCSVFKKGGIRGAMVSIKRTGSCDTLGRGFCR